MSGELYSTKRCPDCPEGKNLQFIQGPVRGASSNKICTNCHQEYYDTGMGMMYHMPNRIDRLETVYKVEITDEDRERARLDPPGDEIPTVVRDTPDPLEVTDSVALTSQDEAPQDVKFTLFGWIKALFQDWKTNG